MTPPNQAADQTAREEPRSHAANAADDSQAVSRIGLGLAALGRPVYLTAGRSDALGAPGDRSIEAMRTRTFEVLDAAWQLGIRFLDLAPSYGHAEVFLGAWLASHPTRRAQLTISSKWDTSMSLRGTQEPQSMNARSTASRCSRHSGPDSLRPREHPGPLSGPLCNP